MMVDDVLFRPLLGAAEMGQIVERLAALYRRVRKIEAEAPRPPPGPLSAISFSDLAQQPLRSRLESVDDATSGLNYGAWCIGEALIAVGGLELMHYVYAAFEDRLADDGRASSWLDHKWNGVASGDSIWCS